MIAGVAAHDAIAATRHGAIIEATIGLDLIAVIAAFEASAHHAITTARRGAVIEAGVSVIGVAVVAGFKSGVAGVEMLKRGAYLFAIAGCVSGSPRAVRITSPLHPAPPYITLTAMRLQTSRAKGIG